ncbi:MAG: HEPN domain-containing protein [Candidatus Edwardsbacteria bacterium]|nr:HEPN domain-containing protein [Candidatus Edwardsbacteria bacterium]
MDVEKIIKYWFNSAEEDLRVVDHLYEKGDYRHALFFGHLYLEKTMKAMIVSKTNEHAPYSHNLLFLAQKAAVVLPKDIEDFLDEATHWSIAARYPDLNITLIDQENCKNKITKTKEIGRWLQSMPR